MEMVKKDDANDSKTQLTSVRIPRDTLKALQRRAKRKDMSQNAFIVAVLNKSLGLGTKGFDPNPPLPTDEAIANLQARLEVLEKHLGIEAVNPFVTEPVEPERLPIIEAIAERGLLSKAQALELAVGRGLPADSPKIKTPAAKRFANAFTDYANGKSKKNPEEMWGLRRVEIPTANKNKLYGYEDLRK